MRGLNFARCFALFVASCLPGWAQVADPPAPPVQFVPQPTNPVPVVLTPDEFGAIIVEIANRDPIGHALIMKQRAAQQQTAEMAAKAAAAKPADTASEKK